MDDADRLLRDLQGAGLYDPAAADAAERLELLRFNLAQGLSVEELVEAERLGRQAYVGVDPHIRPAGARLTLAEVAERAGVDVDKVRRYWRCIGLVVPAADEPAAYAADVEVARVVLTIESVYGEAVTMQLLRTFGAAVSRIAEAELTSLTTIIGAELLAQGRPVELAQTNVGLVRLIPQVTALFDVVHRHHLHSAMFTLFSDPNTRESQTKDLVVGFADLVGYTEFAASSEPQRVTELMEQFEALARDTVTDHGGRVVKMIGDEVMFVAGEAAAACEIGLALESATAGLSALPQIRVGLACGGVLTGYGDYYGPVVNLASRLVSASRPGGVLVDAEVRRRALETDPGLGFREGGGRLLKGFPESVETYELVLDAGDRPTGP